MKRMYKDWSPNLLKNLVLTVSYLVPKSRYRYLNVPRIHANQSLKISRANKKLGKVALHMYAKGVGYQP